MVIENMNDYICSTEECIVKIRQGLSHKMNELYEIIGRPIAISIQREVRNNFFSVNYYYIDNKLMIYLFDEVDPDKITAYLMFKRQCSVERPYVYALVCRIQQRVVNEFYKELDEYRKNNSFNVRITKSSVLADKKDYEKLTRVYQKALTKRLKSPYKRIRA